MHGWMGKILQVDLTFSRVSSLDTAPYASHYLGGRGIASRIYWETVKPEIGAFDLNDRPSGGYRCTGCHPHVRSR
ncbi:MAG: hypothetical protein NUV31_11520 [Dehalococcoidales bacterium]|nr:hypothetical protein [Dehalococcoidales bacterium]